MVVFGMVMAIVGILVYLKPEQNGGSIKLKETSKMTPKALNDFKTKVGKYS